MTDPTNPDTDDDGMYDGFEYWFTDWDFDQEPLGMNPLIDNGCEPWIQMEIVTIAMEMEQLTENETFSNLREWESRTWGKYLNEVPFQPAVGIIDFGEDAMNAYMEETGMSLLQAKSAYRRFQSKRS